MTTVPRAGQATDDKTTVLRLQVGDADVWIALMLHLVSIDGRRPRLLRSTRLGRWETAHENSKYE